MTASNYRQSLSLVLAHEGGYTDHPRDPGGPTNLGVTQRVYDAYRAYRGLKTQSVKLISSTEVADLYAKNYWKLVKGDSLPAGLDYAVFDFAVNSGVSRATRYLQRVIGVEDDGALGLISLTAIERAYKADPIKLITKYCLNRLAFLESLDTFDVFGKGWTRRVVGLKDGAQENDKGVLDYAVMMAKRNQIYTLPVSIGSKPDELGAKAIVPLKDDSFVLASVQS